MFKCWSRRIETSPVRIGIETVRKKVIRFDRPSYILIAYGLCVTARRRVEYIELASAAITFEFEFITMPEFNEKYLLETLSQITKIL